MPPRLDDQVRDAILQAIRTGGKSRGAIAREHGVSPWTVGKIARDHDITDAFSREQTKNATEAAVADSRALRAATSRRFLEKASELLDLMDAPHLVFNFGGKDNDYNERLLDGPPTGDLRNLMTSAAIAFDKHMAAERHDAGGDAGQVGALLNDLFEDLRARHDAAPG